MNKKIRERITKRLQIFSVKQATECKGRANEFMTQHKKQKGMHNNIKIQTRIQQ